MSRLLANEKIGWYALTLRLINRKLTIDQSLEVIAPDPDANWKLIRQQETEDIILIRKELTWKEIEQVFGIDKSAARLRVRRAEGLKW